MRAVLLFASLVCLGGLEIAAATPPPKQLPGGTMTLNAPNAVQSMDAANTTYSGITITSGTISALSATALPNPTLTLPAGAAIYPGFIDSHSHAISLLTALATAQNGTPYWISLANVNVMLLPDCPAPAPCFAPVTTQAAVLSLLGQAKPNAAGWILGWNYEPSRLTCGNNTYGFNCPNFENQDQATALQQLNKLQPNTPTLITSESGHIVYVNSAALQQLNICGMTACPTTVRRH